MYEIIEHCFSLHYTVINEIQGIWKKKNHKYWYLKYWIVIYYLQINQISLLGKVYDQVKVQTLLSIIQKEICLANALWGKTNIPEGAYDSKSVR